MHAMEGSQEKGTHFLGPEAASGSWCCRKLGTKTQHEIRLQCVHNDPLVMMANIRIRFQGKSACNDGASFHSRGKLTDLKETELIIQRLGYLVVAQIDVAKHIIMLRSPKDVYV